MSKRIAVVMDPIENINPKKDSTLAMLLAAQEKGWQLEYLTPGDLYQENGVAHARARAVKVFDDLQHWFEFQGDARDCALSEMDVVLMRKDPPFDMDFIYATYLLELAERAGSLIVNKPQSLRDANEKMFTAWFPECCPPTLVSSQAERIKGFLRDKKDIIVKPLDGMGGVSIFRLRENDPNVNVVLELMTLDGQRQIMAQSYIPEITEGDKRILVIDGEPAPFALARIPSQGETRGNLAAGGKGVAVPLTEHDRWLCAQVAPVLREKGLIFVGLDVIGRYLTEINVTSPTCIRELNEQCGLDIAGDLMRCIEQKFTHSA